MFAEIVAAYVQLAEVEQATVTDVPAAPVDPGAIPNTDPNTGTTINQPVVPAPQAGEGVSPKESTTTPDPDGWMTGPNPEGKVIEVPVTPTIPPVAPPTD
jgi:hypothetical protein